MWQWMRSSLFASIIRISRGDKRLLLPYAYVQHQLIRAIQRLLYYFRLVILCDVRAFLRPPFDRARSLAALRPPQVYKFPRLTEHTASFTPLSLAIFTSVRDEGVSRFVSTLAPSLRYARRMPSPMCTEMDHRNSRQTRR